MTTICSRGGAGGALRMGGYVTVTGATVARGPEPACRVSRRGLGRADLA